MAATEKKAVTERKNTNEKRISALKIIRGMARRKDPSPEEMVKKLVEELHITKANASYYVYRVAKDLRAELAKSTKSTVKAKRTKKASTPAVDDKEMPAAGSIAS